MAPSSALRQGLHITSMRPLARLEDEPLSYAIRVDYFLPVPLDLDKKRLLLVSNTHPTTFRHIIPQVD